MKTLFTLVTAGIFSLSAAAYDEGKLTVSYASSRDVQVMIDNRVYTPSDNEVVLNNIQAGQHTIKIYRNRQQNRNNRNGNNRDRERNNQLLYSTVVNVKPSYHVDVVVNRFGKGLIDEQRLGYNSGRDVYDDGNYKIPMSDGEFNQFLANIRSSWFGKLNTARDGISKNYFSVYQLRQVLQIFSSESDKLELAKLSFRNLTDQRNFSQVYDLFSRQGQYELDEYVRANRY